MRNPSRAMGDVPSFFGPPTTLSPRSSRKWKQLGFSDEKEPFFQVIQFHLRMPFLPFVIEVQDERVIECFFCSRGQGGKQVFLQCRVALLFLQLFVCQSVNFEGSGLRFAPRAGAGIGFRSRFSRRLAPFWLRSVSFAGLDRNLAYFWPASNGLCLLTFGVGLASLRF